MTEFLQFALSGITVGSVYALVALGFALIYNASDVINFAQGEFVMIGGMTAAGLVGLGAPLAAAALGATVVAAIVGLLIEKFAVQPVLDEPPATIIIVTIGASLLLRGIAQIVFGKQNHDLPSFVGEQTISIGGATIQPQAVAVLAGAAIVFVGLRIFLTKTGIGREIRATAANRFAARLFGVEIGRIFAVSFLLSAVIGAIGGLLIAPIALTRYDVGSLLALKGFAAAMLGGMGNPLGALLGGLLIGLMEGFGAGYLSSTYKDAIAFSALLAALMFMPNGLLGASKAERV